MTDTTSFAKGQDVLVWLTTKRTAEEGRIIDMLPFGVSVVALDQGVETGDVVFYPWGHIVKLVAVAALAAPIPVEKPVIVVRSRKSSK